MNPTQVKRLAQQTRDTKPMMGRCRASVADDGPASTQHRPNVPSMLRASQEAQLRHPPIPDQRWDSVADAKPSMGQ